MRAVTIGILALMCGGCAAPAFDLVSRDPGAPWLVGQHWVRSESNRATVNAAFVHAWLDHLLFEVEVVNQSDSTLVVDPQAFSFKLSSSGGELPRKLDRSFAAVAPAAVLARLDKEIARESHAGVAVLALASLAVLTAFALDLVEFGQMAEANQTANFTGPGGCVISCDPPRIEPDTYEPLRPDLRRARAFYVQHLLSRVTLAPGESVRGELWLPAWPVRQAIGSAPSENGMSITAVPGVALPDHGLTLRAPDELGALEIEYSVAL